MRSIVERFDEIASQEKFKGWPVVGEYNLGPKVPYFGQVLKYTLRTGNGEEEYFSLLRHFGWAVVFGVTTDLAVPFLIQWKPGVNKPSCELPPGGIGKTPADITEEELLGTVQKAYLKETGFGGGNWEKLTQVDIETGKYRGASPESHGLQAHLYYASGLTQIAQARQPELNEIMETLMVPLEQVWDLINANKVNEISALACAMLGMLRKHPDVRPS